MQLRPLLSLSLLIVLALIRTPSFARPEGRQTALSIVESTALFESRVRPILFNKCFSCHGDKQQKGGVRLNSRESILKQASKGPIVVPGDAESSALVRAIRYDGHINMPPTGKLPEAEIVALTEWIKMGAPWPGDRKKATADSLKQWAFTPLVRAMPPPVKKKRWTRTPVDAFILNRIESRGLQPNSVADRRTLLRRASFGLTGLPPTPIEMKTFADDRSPHAWEKAVDRLLASPRYGERWARHWLDLARFAESHGYEQDYDRPFAYHYRDFVIRALNEDLPYRDFVRWQIAGDEVAPDNPMALMATGFLAAGTHATQITKNQVEKERYDELDDMLSATSTVMLGLTVGCARCHDHKFDPIPQRDYYRMLSTFTTTVRSDYDVNLDPQTYRKAKAEFDQAHAPFVEARDRYEREELLKRVWPELPTRAAADQAALLRWLRTLDPGWLQLNAAVQVHLATAPKPNLVKALISSEGVPAVRTHTQGGDFLEATHFLRRGDPNLKESVATQGFLTVLMRAADQEKRWQVARPVGWRTSYLRTSFANWITDVDHGAGALLARVIVNRLWQHHLGRGIVATPNDFGSQGERPTHPELLDWLAQELIRQGWHLKPIHRLILLSSTYQQSSNPRPRLAEAAGMGSDSGNRFFTRYARRRIEAEAIRDSMLAVSGQLDRRMYGPGTLDETMKRRSVYFFVKRSRLIPGMMLFDAPNALTSIAVRPSTTIAPQALMLLNNANVRASALAFARRLMTDHPGAERNRARAAFQTALGRIPQETELRETLQFIEEQKRSYQATGVDAEEMAWADFCQVLMSSNEFVYVE